MTSRSLEPYRAFCRRRAMKMWLSVAIAICVAASAAGSGWSNEPSGFRGVPWGASKAEFRKAFPGAQDTVPQAMFVEGFEVGTVKMRLNFIFTDDLSACRQITMEFPMNDLKTVQAIFKEKYGPPNGHRMEYGDRQEVWKGKVVEIELGKDSDAKKAGATFTVKAVDRRATDEFKKKLEDEKKAADAKNKKAVNSF